MRFSSSRAHIFDAGQFETGVVDSPAILDGAIVNADVNIGASIPYSKLNSAAVNVNIVPDGHATRNLGDGGAYWNVAWIYQLILTYFSTHFIPSSDNTWDIGSLALMWKDVYANSLQGPARTEMILWALMGEK
jgi:hypothetical protein